MSLLQTGGTKELLFSSIHSSTLMISKAIAPNNHTQTRSGGSVLWQVGVVRCAPSPTPSAAATRCCQPLLHLRSIETETQKLRSPPIRVYVGEGMEDLKRAWDSGRSASSAGRSPTFVAMQRPAGKEPWGSEGSTVKTRSSGSGSSHVTIVQPVS